MAQNNPHDITGGAGARARQQDSWAMYYVVRNDRRLSFGQAMAISGAGAVACSDRFRRSERWAANFAAWQSLSRGKIALRADPEQFDCVVELDGALIATEAGPTVVCLPPRRKSEREAVLTELVAFTDAKRPFQTSEAPTGALIYVVRADVFKNMGKAMAHAGHAALKVVNRLGASYGSEFQRWRAQGMAGDVRIADEEMWERLKSEVDCIFVKDAGSTQLARGTETVLASSADGAAGSRQKPRVCGLAQGPMPTPDHRTALLKLIGLLSTLSAVDAVEQIRGRYQQRLGWLGDCSDARLSLDPGYMGHIEVGCVSQFGSWH